MLKNTVLYQLKRDNFAPSFIFGTMHVRDDAAFSHLDAAMEVMDRCTHFYAEMDLDEAQQKIRPQDYLLPDAQTIEMLMKPAHYNKLRKIFQKAFEFKLDEWKHYYPMIIVNQLAELILEKDEALALDAYLWTQAKSNSKILGGLESVDSQIKTLHNSDMEAQIKMLKSSGRDIKKFRKGILCLTRKYKEGDIKAIYQLSKKGLGKMKHALLYKRNKEMADRIVLSMDHPSLYTVGAAHLAGAKGILKILKDKGVNVTPYLNQR